MPIFVIMGVSGSGKSTISDLLAKSLRVPYFDADDFHPEANIKKMKNGEALTDEDRKPWLQRIADKMNESPNAVLACSALKEIYRSYLTEAISKHKIIYIYLKGTKETIHKRMLERDHFMPPSLLDSQFKTLEEPLQAIVCDIENSTDEIIKYILLRIEDRNKTVVDNSMK